MEKESKKPKGKIDKPPKDKMIQSTGSKKSPGLVTK